MRIYNWATKNALSLLGEILTVTLPIQTCASIRLSEADLVVSSATVSSVYADAAICSHLTWEHFHTGFTPVFFPRLRLLCFHRHGRTSTVTVGVHPKWDPVSCTVHYFLLIRDRRVLDYIQYISSHVVVLQSGIQIDLNVFLKNFCQPSTQNTIMSMWKKNRIYF